MVMLASWWRGAFYQQINGSWSECFREMDGGKFRAILEENLLEAEKDQVDVHLPAGK